MSSRPTPDRAKTATLPAQWLVRGNGRWPLPELSIDVLLAETVLPAPAPSSFGLAGSFLPGDAVALPRTWRYLVRGGEVPLPPESPWSRLQPRAEPIIAIPRAPKRSSFQRTEGDVESAGLQDPWRRPFETADIIGFSFPFKLSPM